MLSKIGYITDAAYDEIVLETSAAGRFARRAVEYWEENIPPPHPVIVSERRACIITLATMHSIHPLLLLHIMRRARQAERRAAVAIPEWLRLKCSH